METIYANGKNGRYVAVEIVGNVATMERNRGVTTKQAEAALNQHDPRGWHVYYTDSDYHFFRPSA